MSMRMMRTERRLCAQVRRPVLKPHYARGPYAPQLRPYSAPSTSESITLPDDRKLSFARYGASNGYPVFYLHGLPGSRLEASHFHDDASKLGVNLISVDRPGLGYSSPKPGRTPLDHAEDIRHLTKQLGIDQYKILGVSGGGPYSLACAYAHSPTNLKGVAILCGMAWLPNIGYRGMRLGNKILFQAVRSIPGLFRWFADYTVRKQLALSDEQVVEIARKRLKSRLNNLSAEEQELLADGSLIRQSMPSAREHFRQGVDGTVEEHRVLSSEVGFDLASIHFSPISLWYGSKDVNVPATIGEELAKRLGTPPQLNIVDETHLSLFVKYRKRVLEDLLNRS